MPVLDPDSPARVLSPPISIRRAEAEFVGTVAGDLIQVRQVSQDAQDNVTAGYNALVRGDLGSALDFYTAALEAPNGADQHSWSFGTERRPVKTWPVG